MNVNNQQEGPGFAPNNIGPAAGANGAPSHGTAITFGLLFGTMVEPQFNDPIAIGVAATVTSIVALRAADAALGTFPVLATGGLVGFFGNLAAAGSNSYPLTSYDHASVAAAGRFAIATAVVTAAGHFIGVPPSFAFPTALAAVGTFSAARAAATPAAVRNQAVRNEEELRLTAEAYGMLSAALIPGRRDAGPSNNVPGATHVPFTGASVFDQSVVTANQHRVPRAGHPQIYDYPDGGVATPIEDTDFEMAVPREVGADSSENNNLTQAVPFVQVETPEAVSVSHLPVAEARLRNERR